MEKIVKIARRRGKQRHTHFKKNYFENEAWAQNSVICGLDEVGRGCLAGPLVTAAVILPPYKISKLIKDSKLMTPEERLKAYIWIEKHCMYSLGIIHHRLIDERNIWHATLLGMKKALVNLLAKAPQKPSAIIIDAMPLTLFDTTYKDIPVHHFPFGERKSTSIAAASIVAKVKRDEMMRRLDILFPGYYLGQHKGYSTDLHKTTLKERNSRLIIHRDSFLKNLDLVPNDDSNEQQSLLSLQEPAPQEGLL